MEASNPLEKFNTNTVEKLEQAREQKKADEARRAEELKQYSVSLNRLAQSEDGKFVLKHLIEFCGIYHEDDRAPDGTLAVLKGRRQVYLQAIRPFLEKPIRKEVETQ